MLNIGGIANLTLLPRSLNPGEVMSTDVGPGNTIMDAFVQRNFSGMLFDEDSALARSGVVSNSLLASLKEDEFFDASFPKTIGPELFNLEYLASAAIKAGRADLSAEDQLATLNKFSADAIVDAILASIRDVDDFSIYSSGGGIHNPLLVENIERQLDGLPIRTTDALSIDPDAKEAVVFAVLANECVAGEHVYELGKSLPNVGAVAGPVTMGKISFPD